MSQVTIEVLSGNQAATTVARNGNGHNSGAEALSHLPEHNYSPETVIEFYNALIVLYFAMLEAWKRHDIEDAVQTLRRIYDAFAISHAQSPVMEKLTSTAGLGNGNTISPWEHITRQIIALRRIFHRFDDHGHEGHTANQQEQSMIAPDILEYIKNQSSHLLLPLRDMSFMHDIGKFIDLSARAHPAISASIESIFLGRVQEKQDMSIPNEIQYYLLLLCRDHHVFEHLAKFVNPEVISGVRKVQVEALAKRKAGEDVDWQKVEQDIETIIQTFVAQHGIQAFFDYQKARITGDDAVFNPDGSQKEYPQNSGPNQGVATFVRRPDLLGALYVFTVSDISTNEAYPFLYGKVNEWIIRSLISWWESYPERATADPESAFSQRLLAVSEGHS